MKIAEISPPSYSTGGQSQGGSCLITSSDESELSEVGYDGCVITSGSDTSSISDISSVSDTGGDSIVLYDECLLTSSSSDICESSDSQEDGCLLSSSSSSYADNGDQDSRDSLSDFSESDVPYPERTTPMLAITTGVEYDESVSVSTATSVETEPESPITPDICYGGPTYLPINHNHQPHRWQLAEYGRNLLARYLS